MAWKILLDFDSFYVSVIRMFEPWSEKKAMLVRSNNDGPGICVSRECKKLGLKMFSDITIMEDLIKKHDIIDYSVNFTLIGDISKRAKSIMERYFTNIIEYSCDEVFCEVDAPLEVVKARCEEVRHLMMRGLHLPLSIGIARTNTLAKVAIEFAKKVPGYKGICAIDTERQRVKALQLTPLGDVWGIGRRIEPKLKRLYPGMETAYDFTAHKDVSAAGIRKNFNVVLERTRQELMGHPCIIPKDIKEERKSIVVSRSFGHNVNDKEQIKMAMTTYVWMAAEKLRAQKSKTKTVRFFMETNRYRPDLGEDYPGIEIQLPVATSSSIELSEYGMVAVDAMTQDGIYYKYCGIGVDDFCDEDGVQGNLMDFRDRAKEDRLMKSVDFINGKYGRFTVGPGILISDKSDWKIRQKNLPPYWTTRTDDYPKAVDYPTPGSSAVVQARRVGTYFYESASR